MKRIFALVEGPTEENFVNNILYPYFEPSEIYIKPITIVTKRVKGGPNYKGGIKSFGKVENDLKRLFTDSSVHIFTTMIDYYRLPSDFPGYDEQPKGTCHQKVEYLERRFAEKIDNPRFMPYLQLHEFEAYLFSSPDGLSEILPGKREEIIDIISQFKSPEEINDGENTSPSKRIKSLFPKYKKPYHGYLILEKIGIDLIKKNCLHFNNWINKLEKF